MKRVAIISDIHGNPAALLKVIADARKLGCGRIVCLGDIVGYGYAPNDCVDICRREGIECVIGNHDAGLVGKLSLGWFNRFARDAVLRQRSMVTEDNKEWLSSLPYVISELKEESVLHFAFSHGTYVIPEEFSYIDSKVEAYYESKALESVGIDALFVGHTHEAITYVKERNNEENEITVDNDDVTKIDLNDAVGKRYIINVGSCGYPRNQPYSIYGIYDADDRVFEYRMLPFDFKDYRKNMKSVGAEVPSWFDSRERRAKDNPIAYV